MAWETPKTDWYGEINQEGIYQGDRFNANDFNRIKNNLDYLREFAIKLYPGFSINSLGSDRTPDNFIYADEINLLEDNLEIIINNTFCKDYGVKQIYTDNGAFINYEELNRLESATLDIYNQLLNQYNGRRMLALTLGRREIF